MCAVWPQDADTRSDRTTVAKFVTVFLESEFGIQRKDAKSVLFAGKFSFALLKLDASKTSHSEAVSKLLEAFDSTDLEEVLASLGTPTYTDKAVQAIAARRWLRAWSDRLVAWFPHIAEAEYSAATTFLGAAGELSRIINTASPPRKILGLVAMPSSLLGDLAEIASNVQGFWLSCSKTRMEIATAIAGAKAYILGASDVTCGGSAASASAAAAASAGGDTVGDEVAETSPDGGLDELVGRIKSFDGAVTDKQLSGICQQLSSLLREGKTITSATELRLEESDKSLDEAGTELAETLNDILARPVIYVVQAGGLEITSTGSTKELCIVKVGRSTLGGLCSRLANVATGARKVGMTLLNGGLRSVRSLSRHPCMVLFFTVEEDLAVQAETQIRAHMGVSIPVQAWASLAGSAPPPLMAPSEWVLSTQEYIESVGAAFRSSHLIGTTMEELTNLVLAEWSDVMNFKVTVTSKQRSFTLGACTSLPLGRWSAGQVRRHLTLLDS